MVKNKFEIPTPILCFLVLNSYDSIAVYLSLYLYVEHFIL